MAQPLAAVELGAAPVREPGAAGDLGPAFGRDVEARMAAPDALTAALDVPERPTA